VKKNQLWATLAIVAAGIAIGIAILTTGRHGSGDGRDHGAEKEAGAKTAKGPHGGRLLAQDDFALEVAIFERGVPPELRVYTYEKGKPVPPAEVKVAVQLERLGAPPEAIAFQPRGDHLGGDREIEEPHSFKVTVAAERGGKRYRWEYEQEEGRVKMTDAATKGAGIELATAGPARIRSMLQLQGEIQFNGDRVAHVVPRLAGVVVGSAKNLGDPVKKGELLITLESQTLADLRSERLAALTRLELARTTFDREKRLWEGKISAEQDYLASRTALAEAEIAYRTATQKLAALGLTPAEIARGGAEGLTRYEIRAPIDGLVIEKHAAVGEAVKEDATIFVVADLSTVWVEMTVYPKDLDKVKVGQQVTVRATAFAATAEGRVSYVGSLVGEQTRSAKARVTLPNPERAWRPGLFVTVDLVENEAEVPVAVPVGAIQDYRDGNVVFGRFGDVFEARPVELGRTDGRTVEIVKGLAAGTQYGATNSYVLKADLGKAGASHDH
jgi:cobalt-zinc-cadmium efflux system membrane fusion protein